LIRWVNQDKLNNNFFNNKKVRYWGYKIKKIHSDYIYKCLLENKTITIKQLREYLMLKFFLNISHSHLSCVVKKIGFSLKNVKLEHKPKTYYDKVKDVNTLLKEFYLTVIAFKIKNIICIDETSLNLFLTINYGYSKKGKRCLYKRIIKMFSKSIQEFLL